MKLNTHTSLAHLKTTSKSMQPPSSFLSLMIKNIVGMWNEEQKGEGRRRAAQLAEGLSKANVSSLFCPGLDVLHFRV